MRFREVLEKIKSIKHIEIIIAVVAVALALVIYFSFSTSTNDNVTKDVDDTYTDKVQSQLENTLACIDGAGEVKVMISWDSVMQDGGYLTQSEPTKVPQAIGAVVIAQGADTVRVKLDIYSAVSTLLDLSYDKIAVYKKN